MQFTWRVMNLLSVPLFATEGYSWKFIIFTGDTTSTKVTKNFYIKKNVISGCIFLSFAGDLLTVHICHFISIHYKCLFYCNRSIIKDKLLEGKCNLFCVSWLLLEEYFWKFTFLTSHIFDITTQVLWWSVSNYRHFTWTAMCLLFRLTVSMKWIFLRIHPCRPTYITYMQYILGYIRTIIKDT